MKTVNYFFMAMFCVALLSSCSKDEPMQSPELDENSALKKSKDLTKQGNGAPGGQHYNLNIIGVSKDKTADMDGANGHVIFVPMEGKIKINLEEAEDFKVVDANGTDDGIAEFQLPAPDLDPYVIGDPGDADTETDYSVFVRPLGKPGGVVHHDYGSRCN